MKYSGMVSIGLFLSLSNSVFGNFALAKDLMLMNRIGPTHSELYIADADGTHEHKLLPTSGGLDYNASFSSDGTSVYFTSERIGFGQSDLYRVRLDGTNLETLLNSPNYEDQAAVSPDSTTLAYVSDAQTHRSNIWLLDLASGKKRNLTGSAKIQGNLEQPDGFYRPAWSPDGKWIAFASDRNTEWRGHDNNTGWEHLQELALYIMHPDGTGFRRITGLGVTSGSPKWSADSKSIFYYEMSVEDSWRARISGLSKLATSQIISVAIDTGKRTAWTSGKGIKLSPQPLANHDIAYLTKSAQTSGVAYLLGKTASFPENMRNPSWSADGKLVVYERVDFIPRSYNDRLYSWDTKYDYRYADVFPSFSSTGLLVETNKDKDSSIITAHADGSHQTVIYQSPTVCSDHSNGPCSAQGGAAFGPSWSPDGQWVVFGYGGYLQARDTSVAEIMLVKSDGTDLQELTNGTPNAGFPSFSPDGKEIVYRSWGPNEEGLRIMNLETKTVRVLTEQLDNLPGWSIQNLIVFTRKSADNNFDIFTIRPDGSDLKRVTHYPATDAHAVWSYDGTQIMWNSGQYGFKDEAALYDNSFQPYGQIWVMDADGKHKRPITDSRWEDAMPAYVPSYAQ